MPGRNRTNEDIRLVDSSQPGRGRVEILVNDQWGTICDVFWGLADAEVGCRDLGYTGALTATGGGCKHNSYSLYISCIYSLHYSFFTYRLWSRYRTYSSYRSYVSRI